jgi:hypothetical protein
MNIVPKLSTVLGMLLVGGYIAAGIRYSLYQPERSDNFLWGVYHVHSTVSDGLHSKEEIARQAREAGVSLVLLTDHGGPDFSSSAFRKIINGVVVVGGSEARLPEGRLTFFGARGFPQFSLSSSPPAAINAVMGWGGFPVLAYPKDPLYGWQYWETDLNPGGIEISNLFTSLRCSSIFDKVCLVLYYPFSHYYFLKSVSFPSESIEYWDKFLQARKTWGLVATDAHGGFHIGGSLTVNIPSYAETFSYAGLGIDKRYATEPEKAIRRGDFFNCIRGAGEPLVFEFYATYVASRYRTGSETPVESDLHVRVQTRNQRVRLLIKKDGVTKLSTMENSLDLTAVETGVYRVEAYLQGHPLLPAEVPWIISNPIFVGVSLRKGLSPFAKVASEPTIKNKNRLPLPGTVVLDSESLN